MESLYSTGRTGRTVFGFLVPTTSPSTLSLLGLRDSITPRREGVDMEDKELKSNPLSQQVDLTDRVQIKTQDNKRQFVRNDLVQ